jgi:fengycin family lipopeptide synthetase B
MPMTSERIPELSHQGTRSAQRSIVSKRAVIEKIDPQSDYALSHAQRRMWVMDQAEGKPLAYLVLAAYLLEGRLDRQALNAAFGTVIARHEILRTNFIDKGGPRQIVHPDTSDFRASLEYVDLRGEELLQDTARRIRAEETSTPFDLSRGPLIRAKLLQLGEEEYHLLLTVHHIVTDEWSLQVLNRELLTIYEAFRCQRANPLPPLEIQYKDYAAWQIAQLKGKALEEHKQYWMDVLSGELPVLELPGDFARPAVKSYHGRRLNCEVDRGQGERLRQLALASRCGLFSLLFTGVVVLLHRYTGQEEIILGVPVAGRELRELNGQLGCYANTVVIRVRFSGRQTFRELLESAKKTILNALDHQAYPFDSLIDDLHIASDPSRSPLFDVMVGLHNAHSVMDQPFPASGIKATFIEYEYQTSKFDLSFIFGDYGAQIDAQIEYNTDLYRTTSIARMARNLGSIYDAVTSNPDAVLAEIPMLTQSERQQLLVEWNDSAVRHQTDSFIHELVEAQVERTPDSVAVVFEDEYLTYAGMNARANQIAHGLMRIGIRPGSTVGILLDRSFEMVLALLGVVKAGGAYVPLDPRSPSDRLSFMLADANVSVLLTAEKFTNSLAALRIPCIKLDSQWQTFSQESIANLPRKGSLDDLIAVLYTSGSTGMPKGVMIENRAFLNLCQWYGKFCSFTPESRSLLMMVFSFDAAFKNIMCPLIAGGRLILANPGPYDPTVLLEALDRSQATFINTTPNQIYPLLELAEIDSFRAFAQLECLILGGEPTIGKKLASWASVAKQSCQLANLYGPTECSDCVAIYRLAWQEIYTSDLIPAGRPIDNGVAYVVDKNLNELPVGIPGELAVAGRLISRGYLNSPDETANRFVPNPFGNGERMYLTGDQARWRYDGQLEILGRIGHGQVKIRGIRTELSGIESVLRGHPAIKDCVVLPHKTALGDYEPVSYLVLQGNEEPQISDLLDLLRSKLPENMIPSEFVIIKEFPVTPHGKIDRRNLPRIGDPGIITLARSAQYDPPTNELELRLTEVWQSVLGKTRIGVNDNYFQLGGDSIRAIRIASRLYQSGLIIKVRDIFECATISALARRVKVIDADSDYRDTSANVPATPIQRWLAESFAAHARNPRDNTALVDTNQAINAEALRAALNKIFEYQDALRMTMIQDTELSVMPFRTDFETLLELNLRDFSDPEAAMEAAANDIQQAIDAATGSLMKAVLLHLPGRDRLLFIASRLIFDFASWQILIEDIGKLYSQYIEGRLLQLQERPASFRVWAERVSQYANSETLLAEKPYWSELLRTPMPTVKKDFPDGSNLVSDQVEMSAALDEEHTILLQEDANRAFNTRPEHLVLAALAIAFNSSFNLESIAVMIEKDGRHSALSGDLNLKRTIGQFTYRYPVVLDLSRYRDLRSRLMYVKDCLLRVPNEGIGYGLLRYSTDPSHGAELDSGLIPQVDFCYHSPFTSGESGESDFSLASEPLNWAQSIGSEKGPCLALSCRVIENRFRTTLSYSHHQFREQTIGLLLKNMTSCLTQILDYCSSQDASENTPTDFTYKDLSIENLENLFD